MAFRTGLFLNSLAFFCEKIAYRDLRIKKYTYICNRNEVLCIRANTRVAKWGRL